MDYIPNVFFCQIFLKNKNPPRGLFLMQSHFFLAGKIRFVPNCQNKNFENRVEIDNKHKQNNGNERKNHKKNNLDTDNRKICERT